MTAGVTSLNVATAMVATGGSPMNRFIQAEALLDGQRLTLAHYHYDPLPRRTAKHVTTQGHRRITTFLSQGLRLLVEHNTTTYSLIHL